MSDTLQRGYFKAGPPGAPSLVVIHEWWGLNAHLKAVADRFAAAGFTVFAADLYGGQVATTPEQAEALMQGLDWKEALPALGEALAALKSRDPATKVAVLGFCLGGALALAAASKYPFDACVPFYGIPRPENADLQQLRCKVMGHFAEHDDWCTPARVDALQKQLPKATLHRYEAQHAFFNDTRPEVYSVPHAALAWERTLTFLKAELVAS